MHILKAGNVDVAMTMLLTGYKEELNLYSVVRELTLSQQRILHNGRDLMRFNDMLDEKEDVLRLIDQIDEELSKAKTVVTSQRPTSTCRKKELAHVLDQVTETLEDIRAMERENVELLDVEAVAV